MLGLLDRGCSGDHYVVSKCLYILEWHTGRKRGRGHDSDAKNVVPQQTEKEYVKNDKKIHECNDMHTYLTRIAVLF